MRRVPIVEGDRGNQETDVAGTEISTDLAQSEPWPGCDRMIIDAGTEVRRPVVVESEESRLGAVDVEW